MKTAVATSHYSIEDDAWKILVKVEYGTCSVETVALIIDEALARLKIEHLTSDPIFQKSKHLKRIENDNSRRKA